MSSNRSVVFLLAGFVCVLDACGKDVQQKPGTSGVDSTVATVTPRPQPRNSGWDASAAGTFIVLSVADDNIDAALVLPDETDSSLARTTAPDISSFSDVAVDLFNAAGLVGTSTLAVNPQQQPGEGCLIWPSVRLTTKPGKDWKVGFTKAKATGIPIRAIEELGAADSLSSAAELTRLASLATATKTDPAFQGLPFAVRKAYQFSLGDTVVLVGGIVRKINEEANPREEHLLLVAERVGPAGNYSLAFQVALQEPKTPSERTRFSRQ